MNGDSKKDFDWKAFERFVFILIFVDYMSKALGMIVGLLLWMWWRYL